MRKKIILLVLFLFISVNAFSQGSYYGLDDSLFLIIEEDNVQYFVVENSPNFDIALFAIKINDYKRKNWYENEVIQRAISEPGVEREDKEGVQKIPQPIQDYGFTQENLQGYRKESNKEYFIFYNWVTQEPDDLVTFVVQGQ